MGTLKCNTRLLVIIFFLFHVNMAKSCDLCAEEGSLAIAATSINIKGASIIGLTPNIKRSKTGEIHCRKLEYRFFNAISPVKFTYICHRVLHLVVLNFRSRYFWCQTSFSERCFETEHPSESKMVP